MQPREAGGLERRGFAAHVLVEFLGHAARAVHATGPGVDRADFAGDSEVGALALRATAPKERATCSVISQLLITP